MKYADNLRAEVARLNDERTALLAELDDLAEFDPAADGESRSQTDIDARVSAILERGKQIKDDVDAKLARAADLDAIEAERDAAPTPHQPPNFNRNTKAGGDEVRTMNASQLTDMVVRSIDEHGIDSTVAKARIRRHRGDREWLQSIAVRSTPEYTSAFLKLVGKREWAMTPEEQRAAIAVGTNTQGGYLVPTYLDPTLIITNTANNVDVIRPVSRVVTLTSGNTWNGVTSGGLTASWDGELVEVSDDTPGFASVSIPIFKAQAFVQASIEAFEDIDNLAEDALMLFADAKDCLEAAAHMTGSGNGQPTGIFTALDANTNVEVTSTTAATIGIVDLEGLKRAVPQRWRQNASWVYNPVYGDAIRNLGTSLGYLYSVDITEENTERLLGKRALESDSAPSTQTTTVRDNEMVLGDFRNYVLVDKPGSASIEYIPMLFNTANNLPDGRRGWYMHWRHGADSVNDLAFRLLQDKTSA